MKKLLILGACCLSLHAQAQFKDGNYVYNQMQKDYASSEWFNAIGYVVGVADSNNGIIFCLPNTATAMQLFDLSKQYFAENPASRHFPAAILISAALARPFPCPKKGTKL